MTVTVKGPSRNAVAVRVVPVAITLVAAMTVGITFGDLVTALMCWWSGFICAVFVRAAGNAGDGHA
jgi:hypothetical protein